MKIQLFASLKDFFGKELLITEPVTDVADLKDFLAVKNPSSAALLKSCRFAINDEFVDNNFSLSEHDIISVIPPSSGG